MMLPNQRLLKIISIAYMLTIIPTHISACVVNFLNDTDQRIFLLHAQAGTLNPLEKHEKRRFGTANLPTCFDIYIQEPRKRTIARAYSCEQKAGSTNGIITLKFSDIKNGTNALNFFTITQYKPHSSMVQQVTEKIRKDKNL